MRRPLAAASITLALVAVAGAVAALALALGLGGDDPPEVEVAEIAREARAPSVAGSGDPLAWTERSGDELAARAALGTSHVIYEKSPGGVVESAQRAAGWRRLVEEAARPAGIDPDTLEAMVFLESAGRPEVMADGTPESATGLGQILPSTAVDFLGMRVDLAQSVGLTKRIGRAFARDDDRLAQRLIDTRREIDERFDPRRALEGAARYLEIAGQRLGSPELAVVSYHMGIGNLESVIGAYTGEPAGDGASARLVEDFGLDYSRLYFDSSPDSNRAAWKLLAGFGDDSSLYLWRVRASQQIMSDWRDDPGALATAAELATRKATLEETYHPEDETEVFETPGDVTDARLSGDLVQLPADRGLGFEVAPQTGELASELDVEPELYRALRPEALAALVYLSAKVQAISGERRPLTVTSATRDRAYQDVLIGVNPEATQDYSLHTTGWSFDIRRRYASNRQAAAFQFVLDRLRAHAIIDYAIEPGAIHVTVSDNAELLVE